MQTVSQHNNDTGTPTLGWHTAYNAAYADYALNTPTIHIHQRLAGLQRAPPVLCLTHPTTDTLLLSVGLGCSLSHWAPGSSEPLGHLGLRLGHWPWGQRMHEGALPQAHIQACDR
jgi:hypothetical protein